MDILSAQSDSVCSYMCVWSRSRLLTVQRWDDNVCSSCWRQTEWRTQLLLPLILIICPVLTDCCSAAINLPTTFFFFCLKFPNLPPPPVTLLISPSLLSGHPKQPLHLIVLLPLLSLWWGGQQGSAGLVISSERVCGVCRGVHLNTSSQRWWF